MYQVKYGFKIKSNPPEVNLDACFSTFVLLLQSTEVFRMRKERDRAGL